MSTASEKIIERIRALLALASNNPSEEEAASAAAMASRLMAEHDLEQAEIEARGEAVEAEPLVQASADPDEEGESSRLDGWKAILIFGISKLFAVEAWGNRKGGSTFFGRRTAVQTAGYTYRYLANEVEEQAQRYWRLLQYPTHGKRRTLNDFRRGAAGRLQHRMIHAKAEQDNDRQASEGALIVLARKDEEQDQEWRALAKTLGMKPDAERTIRTRLSDAQRAGEKAGDSMHIHGTGEQRGLRAEALRLGAAS